MHVAEVKRFADLSRRDAVPTQVQCGSPKRYGVTSTLVRRDGARSLRVSKQVQLSGCADKSIAVALQMSSAA